MCVCRVLEVSERVSAAIPVQDSTSKLVVLLGKQICLLDRSTGEVAHTVHV